jgi:type IV pilus biogenesis protein CpaD/CtpE
MRRHIIRTTVLLAGVLLLTGCADRDPYRRTDVWQPTGANAANLAAMVANPYDLIRGHGSDRQLAKAPDLAIERIWVGKPVTLGGPTSGGAAAGGSSAGAGGAGTSGGSGG